MLSPPAHPRALQSCQDSCAVAQRTKWLDLGRSSSFEITKRWSKNREIRHERRIAQKVSYDKS